MTPAPHPVTCAHCGTRFTSSARGRPAVYCGVRCRQAANRQRAAGRSGPPKGPQQPGSVEPLLEVARDLQEQSRETIRLLLNPTFTSSQQALQALEQVERHTEALRAGLIGHLRAGGARWKMLATTLNVSEDTARRRYTTQYIHNRLKPYRTATESSDATPDIDESVELADLYHPDGHQAVYNQLAPALSSLVRKRRQNLQQIAKHIGCDPSYLYRILNGERMPSWTMTSRLGRHCNADLAVLQATWEMEHLRQARVKEATRYRQRTPLPTPAHDVTPEAARTTLLRAILTLWRSAQQPTPQRIALASGNKLSADAAQQVLNGTPANWEHLAAFLSVTGGDVSYFLGWWHAAHPTDDTSEPAASQHGTPSDD